MTERYVLESLQKAVIAAVAASTSPSLPVKMVGRTINPPSDGKWLEVIHIPNNSDTTWGEEKLYRGLLRLILHWPVDDKGAYAPMDLVTSISGYFVKGRKFADTGTHVSVSIINNADFMGVEEQVPEVMYPVSIRYQYYAA